MDHKREHRTPLLARVMGVDSQQQQQSSEGKWRGRGGHHSVPTKVWLLISELLDPTKSRMKVVLSVRIGVSGCFLIWIHEMIPLDMMIATLDLMLDIYIRC